MFLRLSGLAKASVGFYAGFDLSATPPEPDWPMDPVLSDSLLPLQLFCDTCHKMEADLSAVARDPFLRYKLPLDKKYTEKTISDFSYAWPLAKLCLIEDTAVTACVDKCCEGDEICTPDMSADPPTGSCSGSIETCDSSACIHGTCIPNVDGFTCSCDDGWKGTRCDQCDHAVDPCCGSTDPCCGNDDPCCGDTDPCCSNDDPLCGYPVCEAEGYSGHCFAASEDCILPLASPNCLGGTVCCIDNDLPCGRAGYAGYCMDSSLCTTESGESGTSVRGLCPGPSSIRCCLEPFAPDCTADDRYPGDCTTTELCNQKELVSTPLQPTEISMCAAADMCCVDPPSCSSGDATGSCVHNSACSFETVAKDSEALCPGEEEVQCCMDLPTCSIEGTEGQCTDKGNCKGENQVLFSGECIGDSEIMCCIDMPSCIVAGVDGQCIPESSCDGLPALSWHDCPGRASHSVSCCVPELICGAFGADGSYVEGQCQTACSSTTYPLFPPPDSETPYCPDGMPCCIEGVPGCVVADVPGECLLAEDCTELPALSWHNCAEGLSCCIPPGLVCHTADQGSGECKTVCDSLTEELVDGPSYCPSGLGCCVSSSGADDTFNITLETMFVPDQDQQYFWQATARLESVVTDDLIAIDSSRLATPPSNGCAFPDGLIDDLFVCASYGDIDGAGDESGANVLGWGGPTYLRPGDDLPIAGEIVIDTADAQWMRDE